MSRLAASVLIVSVLGTACNCGEQEPPPPESRWSVQAPFAQPVDRLASTNLIACPVIGTERCESGRLQRCTIMDTATRAPASSPDPLLERVLNYDRWYDLYHSPDGQTVNREFQVGIDAGTPETEWAAPELFKRYTGAGDAAIWTGVALNSHLMRYLVTGSEVDYQRMESKVRSMLTLFEVTGVPGYLARNHFLDLPTGAPLSDKHYYEYDAGLTVGFPTRLRRIENPTAVAGLPSEYFTGVPDGDGGTWTGVPMYTGFPSIDQYSGYTVSLPAVWGLLKDPALKERIAYHLTCYLKRLQRLEIRNIQHSPEVINTMNALLRGESDVDLSSIKTIIGYYLPQLNSKTAATFDRSCPDALPHTPSRVLDARSSSFEGDLLTLVGDLSSGQTETSKGIDHYYAPNVRGADAVHLMNLAAVAYYFTGDEQYKTFMDEELIGTFNAPAVAATMSLGKPNKWCRKFYDSHISIPVLWAFTNLLAPSPLRTEMENSLWNDAWLRDGLPLGSAKFGLMTASHPPEGIDVSSAANLAMRDLEHLGGNGSVLMDPRRSYDLVYDELVDAGIERQCPTEEQRVACESGPQIFGFQLQGKKIARPCTGASWECTMQDGLCSVAMAAKPLPGEYRPYEDFIWQRSPYNMSQDFNPEGQEQSPGLDLTEEYWLARYYGITKAGEGQALAWSEVGTCQ